MYEELRGIAEEAKQCGLAVVVWSYPRGSGISKEGETALDVVAYAAQIAAQLGANIVKVKLPSSHLELAEAKKVYEAQRIPLEPLTERVRHVVQSCFDGRRIRHFLGWTEGYRRGADRRGQGDQGRRRIRIDHRPQLISASEGRGDRVAEQNHGHLCWMIAGQMIAAE